MISLLRNASINEQSRIGHSQPMEARSAVAGRNIVIDLRSNGTAVALVMASLLFNQSSYADAPRRNAADAEPTAVCVRKAILKSMAELKTTPSSKVTEEMRRQIGRELDASDEVARLEVKRCLSEEDVYWLGWYETMDTSQLVPKCGLRTTEALKRFNREDDADTDLLNGATKWASLDKIEAHPFFKAQSESREHIRNTSSSQICQEMLRDFGPKGLRFPGLVYR
jgi:hypothetical protein